MRVLHALQQLGFSLEAVGHRVRIEYSAPHPPRAALPLLEELRRRKWEVLEVLNRSGASVELEVAWRVAAMQQQVLSSSVVPSLLARPHALRPGYCFSCGEVRIARMDVRCAHCAQAAWIAVRGVSVQAQGVH